MRVKKREDGGAEGDRTPDLYNAIVALSQLSYGPEIHQQALGGLAHKSGDQRREAAL